MHKNGFTLAEVLLTLAIIGVVAALTIPAVITKVTQEQYVTGLKKAYNTLKAVEREAIQENGEMQYWDWSGDVTVQFEKYFLPHFDVLKNCKTSHENDCSAEGIIFLDGSLWGDFNDPRYYKIVTSDSMSLIYEKYSNSTPPRVKSLFWVDVNGLKGPNVFGRDIFYFGVFPSTLGIKPFGAYNDDGITPMLTSAVNEECNTSSYGEFCAAKVLSEGAMNY